MHATYIWEPLWIFKKDTICQENRPAYLKRYPLYTDIDRNTAQIEIDPNLKNAFAFILVFISFTFGSFYIATSHNCPGAITAIETWNSACNSFLVYCKLYLHSAQLLWACWWIHSTDWYILSSFHFQDILSCVYQKTTDIRQTVLRHKGGVNVLYYSRKVWLWMYEGNFKSSWPSI